jgi:hypothetical protein
MNDKTIKAIKEYYQLGRPIQTIARSYRLSVEEVLDVLGLNDIRTVTSSGDLVGQDETGEDIKIKTETIYKAAFTTD